MKRSFVYLILALALSLLLSACGDMSDRGNIAVSPWPDVTEPVMPIPSIPVSPSVTSGMDDDMGTGTGNSFDRGLDSNAGSAGAGAGTSSPKPTDTAR